MRDIYVTRLSFAVEKRVQSLDFRFKVRGCLKGYIQLICRSSAARVETFVRRGVLSLKLMHQSNNVTSKHEGVGGNIMN